MTLQIVTCHFVKMMHYSDNSVLYHTNISASLFLFLLLLLSEIVYLFLIVCIAFTPLLNCYLFFVSLCEFIEIVFHRHN